MTINYLPGSLPIWPLIDKNGLLAIGGYVASFVASSPLVPKPIYQDEAGDNPYPNPLYVTGNGTFPLQFFADDTPYLLQYYNAQGELLNTVDNFVPNGAGGSEPSTVNADLGNRITNPQLLNPYIIPSPLPATPIFIAPGGWGFNKSNMTATDSITFTPFTFGQSEVPAAPPAYCHYSCTGAGSGETYKYFFKRLGRVELYNATTISIAFQLISSVSSTVQIGINQFFGTGGSPSAPIFTSQTVTLSNTFGIQTVQIAVPSVDTKVRGTNNDDRIELWITLPLNGIADVGFTNAQIVVGTIMPVFVSVPDYQAQADTSASLLPFTPNPFSFPSQIFQGTTPGMGLIILPNGTLGFGIGGAPGEVKNVAYDPIENTGIWVGWLKINSNIVRILNIVDYPNLAAVLGTIWGGDGITTFGLPPLGNTAMITENTGTPTRTIGAIGGADTVGIALANLPALGGGYVFNSGGALDSNSGSHLGIANGGNVPVQIKNPFCVMAAMIKY